MKKIVFFLVGVLAGHALLAQAMPDSFETKEVLLKEIFIDAGSLQGNVKFRPKRNVQSSTDQVLNSLPGVSVIKRGGYAWEPGIRGLNNGQVSMTIDGMAIFGACTDRMDPISSYIEPGNLKSMVISYGVNETTTGNSLGGGIDFRLNHPAFSAEKSIKGMAATSYETNGNVFQLMAKMDYSTNRIGINVNGIFKQAGSYRSGGGTIIPYSGYSKWNAGFGLKYKVNEHNTLMLNYIHDKAYDVGYPALLMDVRFARADIFSLTHSRHFSSDIVKKLETKIYFNYIDHAMDDTHRPANQISMHMDMPGTSMTAGLNSAATIRWGQHDLKAKLSLYQNDLHAEMTMYPKDATPMFMLTIPDARRRYLEMNLSDQIQAGERLSIQSTLSASMANAAIISEEGKKTLQGSVDGKLRQNKVLFSGALNPQYRINHEISIDASIAYAMRAATLQELYGFYLFNRLDAFDYLGNPLLRPEKSLNLSAGLQWQPEKVKLDAWGFVYRISDYIAGVRRPEFDVMTEGAFGVKQYHNIGSARLMGFELNAHWKISDAISFVSNNAYSYGIDREKHALPMIPPFKSTDKVAVSWKQFHIGPELVFAAAQRHVSSKVYGETATPSSAVFNFFADRNFKLPGGILSISGSLTNIFDLKYSDHLDIANLPRQGRSATLQICWVF